MHCCYVSGAKLRSLDGVGRHRRLCDPPYTLRFLACVDPGRKYLRHRQPSSSSLQSNYLLSPFVDQYSIRRPRIPNVGLPPPLRYNLAAFTPFHLRSLASQFSNPPRSWGRLAGSLAPSHSSAAPSCHHLFLISR